MLTALLSVWAWTATLERPRSTRRWAAWALAGAACPWTHYYAAFLLAAEAWAMVEPRRRGTRALALVEDAPPPGFPGPIFRLVAEREHRGFRLLLYRSPAPASVDSGALGTDPRYGQPRALTLAPRPTR